MIVKIYVFRYDATLPDFLRGFTSCGVYVRIMTHGVDLLQRRKEYKNANKLLTKLLENKVYGQSVRGFWSERLAINLEVHLKQPAEVCITTSSNS